MALRRRGGEGKEGGRGKKTKRWEREKENDKREQTKLKKQATTVPNIRQKKEEESTDSKGKCKWEQKRNVT